MQTRNKKKTGAAVKALAGVGAAGLALYGAKVLIDFYGPQPRYAMQNPNCRLDSDAFIQFLSLITDGTRRRCQIERLKNGDEFYPAMLDAILGAQRAINLEMYEFREGRVSAALLEALTARAHAGVEVKLIVDAVGSLQTANRYFSRLRAAGGEVCWYHPLRWNTWPSLNQRTHRKLLIVDSRIGFIGGAGIADCWMYRTHNTPVWRDTMFRVEGRASCRLDLYLL